MKKKSGSRTANIFRRTFAIKKWADWDRISSFPAFLGNWCKRYFVPNSNARVETFDTVKKNLNLSEADLLNQQKSLYRLSIIMLCASALIFIYTVFNLLSGYIAATALSFVVSLLALVMAFRYNYWYFLIKQKNLQLTLRQWFKKAIMGDRNE